MKFNTLVEKILLEADPKKGTGKKPKGSGRRLYTDENPKDTVSVKFSSVADIRDTLNKSTFKSKPHKRQSQIINLIHQRVRAAVGRTKDPKKKRSLRAAFNYIKKKKWIPALNRFKNVLNDYETTVHVEEAIHRLVEIYYKLGMEQESLKYASLLGYNYNSGEWYKETYRIFNKEYKVSLPKNKKQKSKILSKLKNLF